MGIQVPHPKDKRQFIAVNVPAGAKGGAAMLVPMPPLPSTPAVAATPTPARASEAAATAPVAGPAEEKKSGWSTGAKVAAGGAALVGVGGLAVAGAVLGEHIAEEGWDATMAELGDAAADAGEAIAGAAEDAGEAIVGAAEDAVNGSPALQRMRGNGSLALRRMLETSSWTFSKAGGSRWLEALASSSEEAEASFV